MVAISQRAHPRHTASPGSGGIAITRGGQTSGSQDPYSAHVAALQAIDPSGSYYTAQDYTASLSQAGRFVDAFGGSRIYDSPSVAASPTRVVDPTSGMVYVTVDGVNDTAIASTVQTCAAYTLLWRSPDDSFQSYGSFIDNSDPAGNDRLGLFFQGTTHFYDPEAPRSVRRNDVALASPYDLAPLTAWTVVTVFTNTPLASMLCQLFAQQNSQFLAADLAAIRTWATDPSEGAVAATKGEMVRYFAPLTGRYPVQISATNAQGTGTQTLYLTVNR